jgi:hypothetical protein
MNNHEAPDTNLIQEGVIVTKRRDEKYPKLDASCIWHLNFRVPVRFDGKLIRQSLYTEYFDVAASIRDRFVVPILALNFGVAALKEIGKSIIATEGEAINHLGALKNIITASDGISLTDAYERYLDWMEKSSDCRPGTRRKYADINTVRTVETMLRGLVEVGE